jgi:tetratricopeptide (TPR) repeat protein
MPHRALSWSFPPWLAASLTLTAVLCAPGAAQPDAAELARAQQLVDAGQAAQALPLLDALVRRQPRDAQALLVRSTAHFVLDDLEKGRRDLLRALEVDPGLRQGWLNRAALELSERRYPEALGSLEKARELDPGAADNPLNIGAVLLLLGRLDEASRSFQEYLGRHPGKAEAFYLVAVNYAGSGYAGLALQHLAQAVELDERSRMQARSDARFAELFDHPRFQDLLAVDRYRPAAGDHLAERTFEVAYAAGEGALLQAVLDALLLLHVPFDPRVEVTPEWALIWGEMRIRVADAPGGGIVQLNAPYEAFAPTRWQARSKELLDAVFVHLQKRRR